jgi:predicted transport protein
MPLFKHAHGRIEQIKEAPFKLEKEIQKIVEDNIPIIFKLQFIKSEFTLNSLRIDTLAFDKDASSFVIIEYKKDRNFSVIDQGMSYLSLMLNNKAEFILEYNEHCNSSLKKADVDWSQSKVIFISPRFTAYQVEAINFKDLPIELWEIHRFSNDTILLDQHKPSSSTASIKTVSQKSETVETISKEIKSYTENDHLEIAADNIKELYQRFRELVLSISSDINVKVLHRWISFKSESTITDVVIQKKTLKILINAKKGKLNDPKKIFNDVSKVGHWGKGDYQIQIFDESNLEYIISLIRQTYKKIHA